MTLLELVDEVYEKTHVDRLEIFSRVRSAWGVDSKKYTATQCALVVRALGGATPPPAQCAPLHRL
jgi:hypothetical protein